MTRSYLTAWILISTGGLLILNYFGLLSLSRANTAILVSMFLAFIFIAKTLQSKSKSGLFGSTFFTLCSLMLIFMKFSWLPIDDRLGEGLVLAILAISNLINYIFSTRKISQLIWSFIFAAIAIPFIIAYYRLIPMDIISDFYETFWPAVLILIGVLVIIDGYIKRRRRMTDSQESTFHG